MAAPPDQVSSSPAQGLARSHVFLDLGVCLFALWTLLANLVVHFGGGLRTLVLCAAGVLVPCVAGWLRLRRSSVPWVPVAAVQERSAGNPTQPWERPFVLAMGLLLAGVLLWRQDVQLLWLMGLPLALWCLWRSVALAPRSAEPLEQRSAAGDGHATRLGLWALALLCVGLTLWAHRADFDDAFYVNLAVHAADAPGAALLTHDTMHGIEGLPLAVSVYRLQSFELLAGALAWLTPWTALEVMHVIFPLGFSLMIPFGLAALLRRLLPRSWFLAVLFGLFFLFVAGDPHRSFGNFSFMRLQQGKSVLLSLMLPLTCAYALDFGRRPSPRSFGMLALVQVAAVGSSVSALWLAPSCAMLALLACLPWSLSGLRRMLIGLLSCAYPLGVGLWISAGVRANLDALGVGSPTAASGPAPAALALIGLALLGLFLSAKPGRLRDAWGNLGALSVGAWCVFVGVFSDAPGSEWLQGLVPDSGDSDLLAETFGQVLGGGGWAAAMLLVFATAWALVPAGLGQRFWALFGAAFFLVFWNPFLAPFLAAKVTGEPTYWRVFWILPAAAWVGSWCVSLLRLGPWGERLDGRWRRPLAWGLGLFCGAGLLFLPGHTSLSPKNQVFFASPGLRARKVDLDTASALARLAGPQTQVLAPVRISPWIPTMHQHPYPLMVRRPYMKNLEGYLSPRDIQERVALTRIVSGDEDLGPAGLRGRDLGRLIRGIETYDLKGLCLSSSVLGDELRAALGELGWESGYQNKLYGVWVSP